MRIRLGMDHVRRCQVAYILSSYVASYIGADWKFDSNIDCKFDWTIDVNSIAKSI